MWLFVFFDLPTKTKKERRKYTQFRNHLLKDGFIMMQFSVYTRICKGDDSIETHKKRVKEHIPPKGNVRMISITDLQYAKMETLIGIKTVEEKLEKKQLLLF
ncbi:CRISPR-associated endonuclease Cas2 [Sulfurimonas sp.]|uniref:CRISPR-associated endonuclease Cas2 n=1 Tax=Sulfurimonas sp. TaxID=2022749 RepID=UPI0025E0CFCE|nr:CRISPR-associated endonuclease Cas2 [Sulfurimonas sp.]MCK9472753.1 CRISPR-associated endonuclease Cas2 [Sulfurimonas sp.]MDD3505474.1 CRISPR-associated endonuclease Cas2 [Sulfurimonas sp.]